MSIAAVVIGRNEGARLIACLEALAGQCDPVIYVDSGSSDGSVEAAQARGAQVAALDMSQPFTAARARNAGLDAVPEEIEFIQFLDGDCVIARRLAGRGCGVFAGPCGCGCGLRAAARGGAQGIGL